MIVHIVRLNLGDTGSSKGEISVQRKLRGQGDHEFLGLNAPTVNSIPKDHLHLTKFSLTD